MVILKRLASVFTPPSGCGPICHAVSAEIEAQALGQRFEQLAKAQRVRCTPSET